MYVIVSIKQLYFQVNQAHFTDHSLLQSFKSLTKLRQKESFQWGKLVACAHNGDVLLFTRKAKGFPSFLTIINIGDSEQQAHLPTIDCVESKDEGTVVYHSREENVGEKFDLTYSSKLEPGDIIVYEFAAD